jgi:DNA-binding LytR/AlgR family response regulator
MMRIAVVEDEQQYTKQLTDFLKRYEEEKGVALEVTCFSDGDEIVRNYKAQFDIILMDVQMKFMNGMAAAEEIRRQDTEVIIIFITNMRQYAIRGYAVDALDYIVKPINYFAFSERFGKAVDRISQRIQQNITINIKGGILRLAVRDIYYVESQGHVLIYHTSSGIYESYGTMKELEEKLKPYHFVRGNKGYLINLVHAEGIQDGCVIVRGERILLSRARKNSFMEMLTNYWSEVL